MKHYTTAVSVFKIFILLIVAIGIRSTAYAQSCPIPFPKGDTATTLRNVSVNVNIGRNDVIFNGSSLPLVPDTIYIVQPPTHGTVVFLNDSVITYTPNPGWVGHDFMRYRVCNSCGNCGEAYIDIYTAPYCPAPTAVNDNLQAYNNVSTTLNVTGNDINIAGGPLTISILDQPTHGTVSVVNGQVIYNGNGSYVGPDTLIYVTCNTCPATNCDTAMVYLSLKTCIGVTASNDNLTLEQSDVRTVNVLLNDANVTGFGSATVTLLNTPKYGGTATVNNGVVTYTAGINGFGLDTIAYRVCTDCGCTTAFLYVNVQQKPCTKPKAFADLRYAGYSVNCINRYDVLNNDIIPINGGNLIVTLASTPAHGVASVNSNGTISYTVTDSAVNATDAILYSICNNCFCDTGLLRINITSYPCNGLNPIVNKDTAYVCRNKSVNINVIANDIDPEGSIVAIGDTNGNGIVGIPAHGTVTKVSATTYNYKPNANFSGTDFFTYVACDNGLPKLCNLARVDVFVNNCNQPPVTPDTVYVTYPEDSFANQCLAYTDVNGYLVRITSIYPNNTQQTITTADTVFGAAAPCTRIVPPTNWNGTEVVRVVICNEYPKCDTTVMIIRVTPRNDPPVAMNKWSYYTWENCYYENLLRLTNDIDVGDRLTITQFTNPTPHGSFTSLGDSLYCYQPATDFSGVDTVRYIVCDTSGACDTAVVYYVVPINARDDQFTTNQEESIQINARDNDTRNSSDTLSICAQPLHGKVTIEAGGFKYVPNDDYPYDPIGTNTIGVGIDSFCYTLCKTVDTVTTCDKATVRLVILPKPAFKIPEGFSPDGDGINDKFVIPSANEYPKSQLIVYNRYGDEVWRNDGEGYQNDFDGTWKRNNEPLPDGSYWYIFKYNADNLKDKIGYIIIHR